MRNARSEASTGSIELGVVGFILGRRLTWTAAILLRLFQELSLSLQHLVLEPLALQVEFDLLPEGRLAHVALIEAAPHK